MLIGTLSATNLRQTYLRGIALGDAWHNADADAAIERLIRAQLALAESYMNIQWAAWRVATAPDPAWQVGVDYDIPGRLLPFVPLEVGATTHVIPLNQHDVQEIAQVRLYQGTSGAPPAPVYETIPLDQVTYAFLAEALQIPDTAVLGATLGQGWAVDYTVGLGQVPDEIAAWINLGAAIEVLSIAGSGASLSGGATEQTLEMDGIREGIKFGRTEEGMYAGTTLRLQMMRDEIDIIKLRYRYQHNHGGWSGTT